VIRRIVVVLASVALAVGMLCWGTWLDGMDAIRKAKAQTVPTRPNFVFILTDDMRKDDLKYMPKTRSLLKRGGMSFENAFVSHALCAPSRATIMRGQYAHNDGVWSNSSTDSSTTSTGGWEAYRDKGNEADNVATRLNGAGYRTGLFGKYMNRYTNTTTIPRGWDRWFAASTIGDPEYFDYDVNDDGTKRHYGTNVDDYITDVLSRKTRAFVGASASQGVPFFAYVAPIAPHAPATPAPRDAHTFDGVKGPRYSSFDEAVISDKPPWIRQLPRLTSDRVSNIDNSHERRVESLQAVDDMVQGVVRTLREAHEMRNTYIFFTSDNGFHLGEHRIPEQKWRPYEEDVRMPLLVRGPGVVAGSTTYKMALNTDFMSTFLDLACSSASPCDTQNWSYVPDGRSLESVLHGTATTWRSAVLLEASANYSPAYRGIRTSGTSGAPKRKYIEYRDSVRELYALGPDPRERTNAYDSASSPNALAARLHELEGCAGNTCRTDEDGP
jgi:N-acetylglucosamine-6-sulfatase